MKLPTISFGEPLKTAILHMSLFVVVVNVGRMEQLSCAKKDHELIGMIELRLDQHCADLGYVIAREYWGNGYATEITQSVVEWAVAQESIYRVWAICDIENLASARVLEKTGMQREGIL
ncbi:MAG: hypothetical protein C0401_05385 [Anaerolinea sp.]|nr:hypothetical protein [Anaerolinea sp.]